MGCYVQSGFPSSIVGLVTDAKTKKTSCWRNDNVTLC